MPEDPSSLWSPGIRAKIQSPKALLRIQAEALARQTGGALVGTIRVKDEGEDKEVVSFDIVVPALDNYRHRILSVAYRKDLPYPCVVDAEIFRGTGAYNIFMQRGMFMGAVNVAENDNEFIEVLRKALQSPQVISVAQSLIARASENDDSSEASTRAEPKGRNEKA